MMSPNTPALDIQPAATSPSSTRSSPPVSPPVELRRLTSNQGLTPQRLSPRNSVHMGGTVRSSRSPAASIPSSPTSVHSSSSAIFERDVEALPSLSLTPAAGNSPTALSHHPSNPHLTARAKGTEAIEQSVPSVLDSAAAVLTSSSPDDLDALDQVSVVAPALGAGSARASALFSTGSARSSPMRSRGTSPMRSRSPSPMNRFSGVFSGVDHSLLIHLPSQTGGSPPATQGIPVRPSINTEKTVTQVPRSVSQSSAASVGTSSSAYFTSPSSAASSPTTTTADRGPTLPTPTPGSTFAAIPPPQLSPSASDAPHLRTPPSPSSAANASKRLSFMSYADLLQSTPASTQPLYQLTTGASTEPPPHLPALGGSQDLFLSTSGERTGRGSAASSVRGLALGSTGHVHGFGGAGASHATHRGRESALPGATDSVGGEWEREGMGMGLEERLEALIGNASREGVVGHA